MKHLLDLLIVFGIVSSVTAQHINREEVPQVRTEATYTVEVAPDIMEVGIRTTELSKRNSPTLQQLEMRLMEVLRGNSIDIQQSLTRTSLGHRWDRKWFAKDEVLQNTEYLLTLPIDSDLLKITNDLKAVNIVEVKLLDVKYLKLEELRVQSLGEAVKKARRKAEAMLAHEKLSVGDAIYISNQTRDVNRFRMSGSNTVLPSEITSSIGFERIRLRVSVAAHFAIVDKE